MTRIYTRTGDDGSTGLADGRRLAKNDPLVEAIGTVDECNAHLGALICLTQDPALAGRLQEIQHRLFDVGAILAGAPGISLGAQQVQKLEHWIDDLESPLPPLTAFVLPGGNAASTQAHIARAVCRRAERRLLDIADRTQLEGPVYMFFNRLSDYLFIVARSLALHEDQLEVKWQR